eukprot:4580499-Prymnesium_polylepis.1
MSIDMRTDRNRKDACSARRDTTSRYLYLTGAPGSVLTISPPVSVGPRPPRTPSTTFATRLNPRHASYTALPH